LEQGGLCAPGYDSRLLLQMKRTIHSLEPTAGTIMVQRPEEMNAFEFVVVSSLRAAQLMRGCTPRVTGIHKTIQTAQLEVAAGKVSRLPAPTASLLSSAAL
jgi:DNA-directed RNA polymerase subunit K/omega